jgi:hypothetical protein
MSKFCLTMGWSDVPHLSEKQKEEMLAALPPHQRDARSKGIPQLGAGAIYPIEESDIVVPDMTIPDFWPKAYGLDIGWNRTAAVWGAWDRENDVVYLYGEHYRGQAEPSIHAHAIRARGGWIPGVIDPAAKGRSQHDGIQILEAYKELGLNLDVADNSREAGIYKVWERLSAGRMKVLQSLGNWRAEFRLYRRDEKGRVVKENDHLMDATRYLIMSGLDRVQTKPVDEKPQVNNYQVGSQGLGWMG